MTTLGRGGSDTTAVAIAAALGADVCEIYTDVAGVFSADPRIVPGARKLAQVSFDEMLEMSSSGAGVLQLRAVEYARNHGVRIHCRSSFEDGPGTLVLGEDETMERPMVTAVTHAYEARVTLTGLRDEPGVAGRVFGALADANVNVDMIIQNEPVSADQKADLSFTVARDDLRSATEVLEPLDVGEGVETDDRGRQGLDRRRRDAQPPRRRREGLPHARRERDQHRDDLHLADQDLLRDRRRPGARRGPGAPRGVRARRRRRARGGPGRRAPPAGRDDEQRDRMSYRVGVVGATGAVGSTMLEVLAERDFPASEVVPFASERSAGKRLPFAGGEIECRPLGDESIQGLDLVLSSAGGAVSAEWAPRFVEAGAVVVDNTSYWRMHDDVPLVVAEVNPDAVDGHNGLVANPNCSTMQMVVALTPIQRAVGIERLVVSTYQSVSAPARTRSRSYAPARGRARTARSPRPRSTRTRSPSTSCPRSRPSRTATTTRPRSAS